MSNFNFSQQSTLLNQARLEVLKAKDDQIKVTINLLLFITHHIVQRILEEAKMKIGEVAKDIPRYKQILENLITQVFVIINN